MAATNVRLETMMVAGNDTPLMKALPIDKGTELYSCRLQTTENRVLLPAYYSLSNQLWGEQAIMSAGTLWSMMCHAQKMWTSSGIQI